MGIRGSTSTRVFIVAAGGAGGSRLPAQAPGKKLTRTKNNKLNVTGLKITVAIFYLLYFTRVQNKNRAEISKL
jgi:hypothetical protein